MGFRLFLHDADTGGYQICYYELEARGPAFVVNVGPLVVGAKPSLEWSAAHARGSSEGSPGCRENADDHLNNSLPSFFLHSAFIVFRG